MVKKQTIKVVKTSLDSREIIDHPQSFPRMPMLYLELFENKAKIKPDMINREYVAEPSPVHHEIPRYSSNIKHDDDERSDGSLGGLLADASRNDDPEPKPEEPHTSSAKLDDDPSPLPSPVSKYDRGARSHKDYDKRKSQEESRSYRDDASEIDEEYRSPIPVASTTPVRKEREYEDSDYGAPSPRPEDRSQAAYPPPPRNDEDHDELSGRLHKLLEETESERSTPARSGKYSVHRDRNGRSVGRTATGMPTTSPPPPPSLAELERQGGYVPRRDLRDINTITVSEQETDDAKRELMFKFDLLRKSYPSHPIPEHTIHSDLSVMRGSYDDTVRRLSLDSSVEQYKTYLIYGFMGCEFVFGNFLGFDMEGFTQQQIVSMNSYEKLLIELGEKSYTPSGSKWPVEIRLLFLIMMNAAFFVVSKMIMKKTGANIMGMMSSMNMSKGPSASDGPAPRPRRKMRGPDIDLSDLPEEE